MPRFRFMRRLDHSWHWVILGVVVLAGVIDYLLSVWLDGEVLLESIPRGERLAVYDATSAAVGPLLGFVVAAVAVLIALPDRPSVERLRGLAAWRALPKMLLVTAGLLTLTLLLTLVGQTADASRVGDWKFEVLVFASMSGSVFGLIVSGVAFALAVTQVHDEDIEG
jgi:xanthine/uracil/vitamin C permease (AzgA family)